MRIYLKDNSVKFHPDPNKNNGALGFFEERRPNNDNNGNKMSIYSNMGSVPRCTILDNNKKTTRT